MKRALAVALALLLSTSTALAQLVTPSNFAPYGTLDGLYLPASATVADDPDAVLWFAAVGTVGTTQRNRVNTLFAALKAAGSFAKADDYWLLVAENTTQALTSLKQRRLGVAVASPVFAVGLGYSFDGSTNYVDTGFIPATHATIATVDAIRFAAYMRAPAFLTASGFIAGARISGGRTVRLRPTAATLSIDTNDVNSVFNTPAVPGYFAGSRSDVTPATKRAFANGAPLTRTVDATSVGTPAINFSLFIGGVNASAVLNQPTACTVGFMTYGAPLTDPQELAEYNAIQAYMVAWGAGV